VPDRAGIVAGLSFAKIAFFSTLASHIRTATCKSSNSLTAKNDHETALFGRKIRGRLKKNDIIANDFSLFCVFCFRKPLPGRTLRREEPSEKIAPENLP
jgi:hypothetical protein